MNIPTIILHIAQTCQQAGATVWLVGGCVRDMFLDVPPKDWDLEVHNISAEKLEIVLKTVGSCSRVGKSFSVFKVAAGNEDIDVALPQNGITDDPYMGIEAALRRRDLTMNAIAYNISEQSFFDPFHGREDIAKRILKATDPKTFIQDPLRVYRVAQFAARFSFDIDPSLADLCRSMSLEGIPSERIHTEIHKMWLKSAAPSIGLLAMKEFHLFDPFPLWSDPTHDNILRAMDRFATQKQNYDEANAICIFWLCALHRLPPHNIEPLLKSLQVHSINKLVVSQRIIPIITHYLALLSDPSPIHIKQFSEHSTLSWAMPVMELIIDDADKVILTKIKEAAQELGVWDTKLPILLQAKELMVLGYVGKEIGIAMQQIREQQILGTIQNSEEAKQFIINN